MRPAFVPVFVLLLVVAAVAVPVTGFTTPQNEAPSAFDSPPLMITPVDNFSNYASITPGNISKSTYGSATVDIGTTVAADATILRSNYRSSAFENRFYSAEDSAERDEIIRAEIDRLAVATATLQSERTTVIRSYADGSTSTETFIQSMALIDAQAREVALTVTKIKRASRSVSYSLPRSLDARLANLGGKAEVLSGPVAQRASRAVAGGETINAVYAESSDTGYTLAMVSDESYVRETYLADERRPDATDQFRESDLYRVNAANRRGIELYPWVTNDASPSGQALGETGIYRFRADYTSGELTAYLDGGTTNVFREFQRQSIAAVPTSDSVTARNDTVWVRVNKTYETGPMSVTVFENGTGRPLNATVSLNGQPLGQTGSDGLIWLVEPRSGVPITVNTSSGTTVAFRLPP
ncbi:hypothetical protein BRC91_07350 [Halobacteriales archaeon QS_4_62_28]|nr:MAG: hypothetical protein BRC91_07350 [Halobacteriales archaeon QS_4_62_28]